MGESSMTENTPDNEMTTDGIRNGVSLAQENGTSPGIKARLAKYSMPFLTGAALLAITVAVSLTTVRLSTPEVVTFDMKGTMDAFLQQSAQLSLDEPQTKVLVANFNAALSHSLEDWQTRHNAVILVTPAVVSTQRDITAEIQNTVARTMNQGKRVPGGEGK